MKLRFAVLAFGFVMGTSHVALANEAVGVWLTEEGKAKVRLTECGQGLCSEIVWLRDARDESGRPVRDHYNPNPSLRSRPVIGIEILQGLQQVAANQWAGQIYNPENGKFYKAHLTILGNQMRLKGCVSFGWPCGEQTWTRVPDRGSQTARVQRATTPPRQATRVAEPPRQEPESQERQTVSASAAALPPLPPATSETRMIDYSKDIPRALPRPEEASRVGPRPVMTGSIREPSGNDYLVQVVARRSEHEAKSAFAELQRRYPALLGTYQPMIKMANLGPKGVWYRVGVGPMDQRFEASAFCDRLKLAGGDCIVRHASE